MISCGCGCQFAPSAETFYAAQIIPGIQYALLFNCPGTLADGTVCASSLSLIMWESFDVALHFGEAEPDEEEWLIAAE